MKRVTKNIGYPLPGAQLIISAIIDEVELLQNVVEKLAHRRIDPGYRYEAMPAGWRSIETSSLEAFVSGDVSISCENEAIRMPFATGFLFTCTKKKKGEYSFSWVNSLS
jgi:hypothetical protein